MQKTPRTPLDEGLRLYWRHLIPIAVFPTVFIVGMGLTRSMVTFILLVPLFFWTTYYAGVPYSRKNVTYYYWLVAGAVWMGGAMIGILVFAGVKALVT